MFICCTEMHKKSPGSQSGGSSRFRMFGNAAFDDGKCETTMQASGYGRGPTHDHELRHSAQPPPSKFDRPPSEQLRSSADASETMTKVMSNTSRLQEQEEEGDEDSIVIEYVTGSGYLSPHRARRPLQIQVPRPRGSSVGSVPGTPRGSGAPATAKAVACGDPAAWVFSGNIRSLSTSRSVSAATATEGAACGGDITAGRVFSRNCRSLSLS